MCLLLFSENDRVVQVNAIPMDGAIHSFAVQTLRKCGKVAKIVSKASISLLKKNLLFTLGIRIFLKWICLCFYGKIQTVKRPRKVPVNVLNRQPSPDDRVFNNDYNDDYNYDQDRRSVYSARSGGGRDQSLERERGGYMDSGYHTRDRDYDRRERGRSTERDLSPDRQYRRDGSRGRTLDREYSPDRRYKSEHALDRDYSPDRRYRSDRTLDRDYSPDRRFRSDRALDRDHSPDRRYRSDRALDRNESPDLRYRRDSPGRGRGRDQSYDRGLDRIASEPRKYDEPIKRSASRDRLERTPSPAAVPLPLPRPARDLEPLEKPVNVLLLKNHPNEGETLKGCQINKTCKWFSSP